METNKKILLKMRLYIYIFFLDIMHGGRDVSENVKLMVELPAAFLIHERRGSEVRNQSQLSHYNTECIFAHRSALECHARV